MENTDNVRNLPKTFGQEIAEEAKKRLKDEKVAEATKKLKVLYAQEADAQRVLDNIKREIADYLKSLEEQNV